MVQYVYVLLRYKQLLENPLTVKQTLFSVKGNETCSRFYHVHMVKFKTKHGDISRRLYFSTHFSIIFYSEITKFVFHCFTLIYK